MHRHRHVCVSVPEGLEDQPPATHALSVATLECPKRNYENLGKLENQRKAKTKKNEKENKRNLNASRKNYGR